MCGKLMNLVRMAESQYLVSGSCWVTLLVALELEIAVFFIKVFKKELCERAMFFLGSFASATATSLWWLMLTNFFFFLNCPAD